MKVGPEATEAELLAAIAAQPDDHTRLVYADWLLARGDKRGELIQLDVRERTTPGGLTHPDQVASLLRLAAEFGFPHLPDPDAGILPFEQLGRDHEYQVVHEGRHYNLSARGFTAADRAALYLNIDGQIIENTSLRLERRWTDQETNVILSITSQAIRELQPFATLWFPAGAMMLKHPAHRLGPLPAYYSAEVVEDFDAPWMLRARDHARWYAIYDRMMAGYSRTTPRK